MNFTRGTALAARTALAVGLGFSVALRASEPGRQPSSLKRGQQVGTASSTSVPQASTAEQQWIDAHLSFPKVEVRSEMRFNSTGTMKIATVRNSFTVAATRPGLWRFRIHEEAEVTHLNSDGEVNNSPNQFDGPPVSDTWCNVRLNSVRWAASRIQTIDGNSVQPTLKITPYSLLMVESNSGVDCTFAPASDFDSKNFKHKFSLVFRNKEQATAVRAAIAEFSKSL